VTTINTRHSVRTLRAIDLGLRPYAEALALLVEHPPVVTLGRRSQPRELLLDRDALARQGIELHAIERGGKTTYHGPGQLVGYPILGLRDLGLAVPRYVALLEHVLIEYLASLGLQASRRPGYPGVWVSGRKIGAIGVHVKRWVTMHGFALNLAPDLRHFQTIVPCGIDDAAVTSVAAELGRAPAMADAKREIAQRFQQAFGYAQLDWAPR
jgi:lipoate-protein ligase B